jgi:hypothetical protein
MLQIRLVKHLRHLGTSNGLIRKMNYAMIYNNFYSNFLLFNKIR